MIVNQPLKDKDKEITKLRSLLKRRNAMIRILKNEIAYCYKYIENIASELSQEKQTQDGWVDGEELPDDPVILAEVKRIFDGKIICTSCGSTELSGISFCTACDTGWAYCESCGGYERAKKENRNHITPTHGIFLDMYDRYLGRNSSN